MPKYEFAIAVRDEVDHTPGKFRKNEGDIISIRLHPRNCGRRVIDESLVVIVECAEEPLKLKTKLRAPLWENGLVEGVDFRDIEKEDGVDPVQYPDKDYVWNIKAEKPMKRPRQEAKRRYKIPLSILPDIDIVKTQNKFCIYQPYKRASQLVEKFDGKKGRHYLETKDVDCSGFGIGTEQEIVFQWSALDNLVIDKYTNFYVGP